MSEHYQDGPIVSCNLIIAYHFCCILFVRNKSLGPAHSLGEGIAQGMNAGRRGLLGGILEVCLTQTSDFEKGGEHF